MTSISVESFLRNYPEKASDAYKGMNGQTLIIGGSYGMAGAVCLNLIGAETSGADYICCALDREIYPIVAAASLTTVFSPLTENSWQEKTAQALRKASSVVFGSGINDLPYKNEMLFYLLENCRVPLLLDAEALQILSRSKGELENVQCPVILTPHVGEFAKLSGKTADEIQKDRVFSAVSFAEQYNVILVLKGASTVIADPQGNYSVNESGNPALARAGSGDVLSGIIGGLITNVKDPFTATCMGVWLHGHLADIGLEKYSAHVFPLESFPELMNLFLHQNGRIN